MAAAERNAAEVQRLRAELAHLQRMISLDDGATGALPVASGGACRTSIADISDAQVGGRAGWWVGCCCGGQSTVFWRHFCLSSVCCSDLSAFLMP